MSYEKETGNKFNSGKPYQENKTNYMDLLKLATSDEQKEVKTKNNNVEKDSLGKELNKKPDNDKYNLLLKQALEADNEFDDLEDGFEEEIEKIKTKAVEKPIDVNKEASIITMNITHFINNEGILVSNENKNKESLPENVLTEEEYLEKTNEINNEDVNILSIDDILEKMDEQSFINENDTIPGIEKFKNDNLFQEEGSIKKIFNPNPPADLIKGKDFNDKCLNIVYAYDYPKEISELRKRKAEERKTKLENLIKEEESLKQKKQKINNKKISNKPKKELKVPSKYPIEYEDPTDEEIDDKTGKPYYYFNFSKTIGNSKLKFLGKILPTNAIDDVLYGKDFLNPIAERQHEKSVKYNNMSAAEQYSLDLRNMGIFIGVISLMLLMVFFKIAFSIIPSNNYETALNSLNNKMYEESYNQFSELGEYEKSVYYAKYSEAKMYYKTEQYEKAKDTFSLLIPYEEDIFKPIGVKISDEMNECSYQLALSYYYNGDFETAKNIFKEIYTYSDSTEKYYECGYKIAKNIYETWQDNEDLEKSLKYFYRVRKYTQSDVQSFITIIAETLYGNAKTYYSQKNYEEALNIYSYLALYNYVDAEDNVSAKDMVNQCTYKYGLDLFKNRQYESARKVLNEIPTYKDSYVLSKECMYNIASILYENNAVASISEYQQLEGYRDTDTMLFSPRLILYGKWQISEINKSAVNPIEFSFFDDGRFLTTKQIQNVAISTSATPFYYEWDGEKYVTKDGEYLIYCSYDKNTNKLTITCNSPSQSTEYTCTRIMSYEEMIVSDINSNKTETGELTLNQRFKILIKSYIDKKIDKSVNLNNEDVNIFEGKID